MMPFFSVNTKLKKNIFEFFFKAFLPQSLQVPAVDNKGIVRNYLTNDLVCCEIIEISSLSEKLVIGMKGQHIDRTKLSSEIKFGLIQSNQLPDKYK